MKQTIPEIAKERHNYTWCVEYGDDREEKYKGKGYFFCHTCHLIDDKWDEGKKVRFQYPKWTCKAFHDVDSPMHPTYKKNKTLNPMLHRRSESVRRKLEEKGELVATPMSPKRARHETMESQTSSSNVPASPEATNISMSISNVSIVPINNVSMLPSNLLSELECIIKEEGMCILWCYIFIFEEIGFKKLIFFHSNFFVSTGMCTLWFTLSATDNQWIDIFKTLHGRIPEFEDPEDLVKWKWKIVCENNSQSYFNDRVEDALESFFGSKGLNYKWSYYIFEKQKCGTALILGCLRLKSNPNIPLLGTQVLKGQISSKIVAMYNSYRDDE